MLPPWADILILSGLPLLLGAVLWKWGGGEPDNAVWHESGEKSGSDEEKPEPDILPLAA